MLKTIGSPSEMTATTNDAAGGSVDDFESDET
jgi:hypothetical protein